MANSLSPLYSVNTAPLSVEKFQGMLINLYPTGIRFCSFEPQADGSLEVGVFVTSTTDIFGTTKVSKPTSAASKVLGVSILNMQRVLDWDANLNCYKFKDKALVPILEKGDTVMYSETVGEVGDTVHFRHSVDAALDRIGAISNIAGTGLDEIASAKYLEKIDAPGLVRVQLNLP